MNIYITPKQRKRMREFDAVINWSQVAVDAFDAAMNAHVRKVELRMSSNKLRASIRAGMDIAAAQGRLPGRPKVTDAEISNVAHMSTREAAQSVDLCHKHYKRRLNRLFKEKV